MINDKTQKAGDNSTNYQAETIHVHQGITYQEAKEIALDVFKSNFVELRAKALEIVNQRAEELTENFLRKLQETSPAAINYMEDPGMQHALYTAQKEYARAGDKDMSNTLVDILVQRANQQQRDLKQIVLDESLSVVPKLTASQLDTLTVIFNIRYSRNSGVGNMGMLKEHLEKTIAPLMHNLSKEQSLYQHLEYTSCGSISIGAVTLEQCVLGSYPGIFSKGFSKKEFETYGIGDIDKFDKLIIPCLNDRTKYQVAALDMDALFNRGKEIGINEEDIRSFGPLLQNYQMSTLEVKEKLITTCSFMNTLFEIWTGSFIQNMSLTSVGIAIAIANLKGKIGNDADLGIWIKN